MKLFFKTVLILAVGALLTTNAIAQDAKIDPNGKWSWTSEGRNGNTRTNTFTLKLVGEKLTGTVLSGRRQQEPTEVAIEEAKIKGDEVSFQITREFNDNKFVTKYIGKIAGDTIKGKTTSERNGQVRENEFTAKRVVAKKEQSPE